MGTEATGAPGLRLASVEPLGEVPQRGRSAPTSSCAWHRATITDTVRSPVCGEADYLATRIRWLVPPLTAEELALAMRLIAVRRQELELAEALGTLLPDRRRLILRHVTESLGLSARPRASNQRRRRPTTIDLRGPAPRGRRTLR